MKVKFEKGNGIEAFFDFTSYYEEIPEGEWEVEAYDYCHVIWLTGPGHGQKGDYGNGRLGIRTIDVPDWLFEKLGIKKDKRKGERRKNKK
jgi:hypothetical protein